MLGAKELLEQRQGRMGLAPSPDPWELACAAGGDGFSGDVLQVFWLRLRFPGTMSLQLRLQNWPTLCYLLTKVPMRSYCCTPSLPSRAV